MWVRLKWSLREPDTSGFESAIHFDLVVFVNDAALLVVKIEGEALDQIGACVGTRLRQRTQLRNKRETHVPPLPRALYVPAALVVVSDPPSHHLR